MSAFCLLSGSLFRGPERKMSKAGKAYATATMRVTGGREAEFWRLLAFSETAIAELMRLGDGDKLAAQGSLRVELYRAGDGSEKLSRTLMADAILPLRPPPRERKPKAAPAGAPPARASARADFDDGLPEEWGAGR
jgi:hypothetical protein